MDTRKNEPKAARNPSSLPELDILGAISQNTNDPIFVKDRDGIYLWVNEAVGYVHGLPADQIVGATDFDLQPPDIAREMREVDNQVIASGASVEVVQTVRVAGGPRVFRTSKTPVRDSKGNVVAVMGVGREITRELEAEKAHHASEARFKSILESAIDGVWIIDPEGKTLYANQSMATMLATSPEAMAESCLFDFVAPESIATCKANMARRASGISERHEFKFVARDGRVVFSYLTTSPLYDDSGNYTGSVATVSDITERYAMEEELRERAQLIELSDEAIFTWSPSGKIRSWNRGAQRIFGFATDEALGASPSELMETEWPHPWPEIEAKLFDSGTWEGDLVRHAKNGNRINVFVKLQVISRPDGSQLVLETCLDITDRLRAEREARVSDHRLRLALRAADISIYTNDLELRYTWVANPFLGLTAEQILGRRDDELIHESSVRELVELKRRVLTNGRGERRRISVWNEGKRYWFDVAIEPSRNRRGVVTGLIAAMADVTASELATEAVRMSEERYRALSNATASIVWTTTADGEMSDMREWCNATGLSHESVRGLGWLDAVTAPQRKPTIDKWSEALRTRSQFEAEFQLRLVTGEERWFSARAVPVLERDGTTREWVGLCEDVNEARTAAQQLEALATERAQTAALLDALIANAPLGFAYFDREHRFIQVNEGLASIDEVSVANHIGKQVEEVLPNAGTLFAISLDEVFAGRRPRTWFTIVVPSPTHPNVRKYCHCSLFPVEGADGTVLWVGAVILDISDRIRQEDQIRQLNEQLEMRVKERTAELEAANNELEGFTYSVAHDLRAPLRHIVSTSRIVLDEASQQLDPDHRDMLQRQAQNALKLGALIDDLLHLARIGRKELALQELDLSRYSNDIAAEVAPRYGNRMTFDVEPALIADGDPVLMRLLLENLLDNAAKYSPNGGTIRVGRIQTDNGEAFYVADEGIGFDMKYVGKLFHPFERLVRDSEFPGTGIGLANVRRVIERHGGEVWAESEPGKGSTFFFTLSSRKS